MLHLLNTQRNTSPLGLRKHKLRNEQRGELTHVDVNANLTLTTGRNISNSGSDNGGNGGLGDGGTGSG